MKTIEELTKVKDKDFMTRLIELVQEDRELHDSLCNYLDASSDLKRAQATKLNNRYKRPEII